MSATNGSWCFKSVEYVSVLYSEHEQINILYKSELNNSESVWRPLFMVNRNLKLIVLSIQMVLYVDMWALIYWPCFKF